MKKILIICINIITLNSCYHIENIESEKYRFYNSNHYKVNWDGTYKYEKWNLDIDRGLGTGITLIIQIDGDKCNFEISGTQVYENINCQINNYKNFIYLESNTGNQKLAVLKYSDNIYTIQTEYIDKDNKYHVIDKINK